MAARRRRRCPHDEPQHSDGQGDERCNDCALSKRRTFAAVKRLPESARTLGDGAVLAFWTHPLSRFEDGEHARVDIFPNAYMEIGLNSRLNLSLCDQGFTRF